jgi:outer membrane protein assembly factor BamB
MFGRTHGLLLLTVASLFSTGGSALGDTNWPRLGGPNGLGVTDEVALPSTFDQKDVSWRRALPGRGFSTPVIWGERIFLTAAEKTGDDVRRIVLCVDRRDGSVVWKKEAVRSSAERTHRMNEYASASCATDGEVVVAFFGPGGLHCFDIDGSKLWSRDLGKFPGPFGTGASPIILGDRVIQNCDAEGKSFLLAVNRKSGKDVWRTPRADKPKGGWNTPILIETATRKELIVNGEFGVKGYDPTTGKELWFCKGFNGRGTPVPASGNGLLFVVNGKPGDIYAVRPGGEGDVSGKRRVWHSARKGGRDLSSPICVGDYVFVVSMGGIGTCYEAATGKPLWVERLGGKYSASPISAGGLIYQLAEDGTMLIIKPGPLLKIVARSKVEGSGETFRASPAASDGQLFLRSDSALYCVGKRTSSTKTE